MGHSVAFAGIEAMSRYLAGELGPSGSSQCLKNVDFRSYPIRNFQFEYFFPDRLLQAQFAQYKIQPYRQRHRCQYPEFDFVSLLEKIEWKA
jgi:hypothetical protein